MSLRAAFGEHGGSDFAFESNVVPFGYYWRSARQPAQTACAAAVSVAGYSMGYHYLVHDFGGALGHHQLDRAAFVQPIGADSSSTGLRSAQSR